MQKLKRKMVIRWEEPGEKPHVERLLLELPGSPAEWAVISLDVNVGLPYSRPAEQIIKAIGVTAKIVEDPYEDILRLTNADLSLAQKAFKDFAWNILGPLLQDLKQPLLFKETRSKEIHKLHKHHHVPIPKLFDWVRRYYQRGMSEFSLAPDFHKRGGPDKAHLCGDKPRGRPPKHGKQTVNITPTIAKALVAGMKEFLADKNNSFKDALDRTKETYFLESVRLEGSRKIYTLQPIAELITPQLARYYLKKFLNLPAFARTRMGAKKYDKDVRGATGNSTLLASGPGALYMIDATIADSWLRHPWTHEPLGRPTVYLVIDVYSHMVVGFHVTFGKPSLIEAAMAIEQAVRNKGEVLKELELDIHPELWPVEGKPHAIMADRGELIGKNSDTIPRLLDCVLVNTAPYRGDSKGIVEQAFRQTNLHTIKWTDGYVSKDRDRDETHPKKLTTVHPRAFCQVLAVGLINRNMDLLDRYPLAKEHYVDSVPPRPLELWRWGMDKETGLLLPVQTKNLHQKLLPRAEVTATRFGFLFDGLTFTNERLEKMDYFSLAGLKSRSKAIIAYDPRSVANTYLVPDKFGSEMEQLELTPKWKENKFGELSWKEVELLFDQGKASKVAAAGRDLHRRINAHAYQIQLLEASTKHFETTAPHGASEDLTQALQFKKLETKFGGAAQVPLTPSPDQNPQRGSTPNVDEDEDEEHAEIAKELLKGSNN